jgi:elongation factor 2
MDPVIKMVKSIMDGNSELMLDLLGKLEIPITTEEKLLKGKQLLKAVMTKWISAADTILEMMVIHLPSPKVA